MWKFAKQSTTPTVVSFGIFIFQTPPFALLSSSLVEEKKKETLETVQMDQFYIKDLTAINRQNKSNLIKSSLC